MESPENFSWPNLNKPTTRKFGATKSPKWLFLGSGPFSEASYGPLRQFSGKAKNTSPDICPESPKNLTWPNLNKPTTGKFEGTFRPKSPISAFLEPQKWPKITF